MMKQILLLLWTLPLILCAQDTSKPKEVTLPQYIPTKKFLDTVNTVWIDSNDWKKGVKFRTWTDNVVILEIRSYCMNKGSIARFGDNADVISATTAMQGWEYIQRWGGSITLEISKVNLRGNPSFAGWVYIVRLR